MSYQNALTAWSILMTFAIIWTIRLMGPRLAYAIPVGLGIAATFPGAYGIGNVVPLIGLGIALAHRYRDNPLLAAAGIVLASAPKTSGLLLVIPFLLTQRWKSVGWSVGFLAVLGALPLAFFPGTWGRYLDAGIESISLISGREDNASVLNLAVKMGMVSVVAASALVVVATLVAWTIKDTFWPVVWLLVAILPIAWMYSLLTLIPLFCMSLRRWNPWSTGAVVLAATLMVGSPPLGMWPTGVLPIVLLLAAVALLQIEEHDFWPDVPALRSRVFQRRRLMQKSGIRVSSEYIQAMGKMATRSHTTGQKVSLIVQATRVATTTSADAATTDTIPILTARLSTEALSSRPEMSDIDSIPASRYRPQVPGKNASGRAPSTARNPTDQPTDFHRWVSRNGMTRSSPLVFGADARTIPAAASSGLSR